MRLEVVEGDIAALEVDAVANAANDRLWMGAGVAGALKRAGGTIFAQDEASSEYFGMPSSAIETGLVDTVLPLDRIASALCELVAVGGPA